jgi:hypothetical protein
MLKNIMIITNRLIITVLSLIIVTVLIFNSTSGSQYGGAEVAPVGPVAPIAPIAPSVPIAPAPIAPIAPSVPIEPIAPAPIAPIAPAPSVPIEPIAPPTNVYKPPPPVIEKFKIGNRNFALAPYEWYPIIYYEDGTVRKINTQQYAFSDVKNGVTTSYSIFSLNNPRSVSLERLNDNLTYFILFPQDVALTKNLKKLKSPVLNKIIDNLYTSTTYSQYGFGSRKPVKIVKTGSSTAVLIEPHGHDDYHLYLIKKGDTWAYSQKKSINGSKDTEDDGRYSDARAVFHAQKVSEIKKKTKYKCDTDEGAQEFLTDLAFYPQLSGCQYESLS